MTPESLDHFFDLLIESLNAVGQEYLYTIYGEMDQVVGYIENLAQQRNIAANIQGSDLYCTGERIFCYELYHQLRVRMEHFPEEFQGVYLQGELRKYQVPAMLDRMDLHYFRPTLFQIFYYILLVMLMTIHL